MTINELYESVAQLGFEDSLDDSGTIRFVQAANRAILQVNSLRPIKRTFVLNHVDPSPYLDTHVKLCERDEDIAFQGNMVKGIYFEVCGEGKAIIKIHKRTRDSQIIPWCKASDAYEICEEISFNTNGFVPFKRIVKNPDRKYVSELVALNDDKEGLFKYSGVVIIEFCGDCLYTIRNLAMYNTITSSDPEKLYPYTEQIPYDMTSLVPDFDRFKTPPLIMCGDRIASDSNYAILGGKTLLLPIAYPGIYTVEYLAKPTPISADLPDNTVIGLDDDLCALLPLLIASYVWLDDEPEKAQYYYNLYTQRAAEISLSTRGDSTLPFISVNGW